MKPSQLRKILWRVMIWRNARERWIANELSQHFYRNYERKPNDIQKVSKGPFLMNLTFKGAK